MHRSASLTCLSWALYPPAYSPLQHSDHCDCEWLQRTSNVLVTAKKVFPFLTNIVINIVGAPTFTQRAVAHTSILGHSSSCSNQLPIDSVGH